MKSVVEFLRGNEQSLLFIGMIVYLMGFLIVFENEMREGGWISAFWLIQFFTLGILYAHRGTKKGWKYPKDIRDTH